MGGKGGIDTPWAIIDLGATYNLDTISLWHLNPSHKTSDKDSITSRAARKVSIYYTTTGVGTITNLNDKVFDSSGWTALGAELDVTRNPGGTTTSNPNLLLTGLTGVQARWVAIEITNIYGNNNHQNKAMISEVQFFAVSEPSTVADNSEPSTVWWIFHNRRCSGGWSFPEWWPCSGAPAPRWPDGQNDFRAPLKTYHDRDESNFDFVQCDSAHRRAGSPSCSDQRRSKTKVLRSERLAACCAQAALLAPRQGFQPNRRHESLACITANQQSRHMGGFQRCPL